MTTGDQLPHGLWTANVPLPNPEVFVNQLLGAADNWWRSHLTDKLVLRPGHDLPCDKAEPGLTLTNPVVLQRLLDVDARKQDLTVKSQNVVREGFNGQVVAQFKPWAGWRFSGFGIWSNLWGLRYALDSVRAAKRVMAKTLATSGIVCTGIPSVIFKPPSKRRGKLPCHNDGGSWADMYKLCFNYRDRTFRDWALSIGVQTLLHVSGAQADEGGHTRCFANLTPRRYLIVLTLVHPHCPHEDMPLPKVGRMKVEPKPIPVADKDTLDSGGSVARAVAEDDDRTRSFRAKWHQSGGPVFYQWFKPSVVQLVNSVVEFLERHPGKTGGQVVAEAERDSSLNAATRRWLQRAHGAGLLAPLIGPAGSETLPRLEVAKLQGPGAGPYLAMWPRGVPHDATVTKGTPRLTFTMPLQPNGKLRCDAYVRRAIRRLRALAKGDVETVRADKEPYAGGHVHSHPESECDLLPFFGHLYATPSEVENYIREHGLERDADHRADVAADSGS